MSLLSKFSLVCMFALVVFGYTFGRIVTQAYEKNTVAHAKNDTADYLRKVMRKTFEPSEFWELEKKPGSPAFCQKMKQLALASHYPRIKIWSRDAQILWSNDKRLVGLIFKDNDDLEEALQGKVISEIKEPTKTEHIHEKDYEQLMEMYVPIYAGIDSPENVLLVMEIYEDLASIYKQIRKNNKVIWTSIGVGFTLLYAMLFGIVWRASKTMKEQTTSLIRSKEQLIQADKMVSLGTLSAGVAHEINNPNQQILTNTRLIAGFCHGIKPILDKYQEEHGDFSIEGVLYSKLRDRLPKLISATNSASNRINRIVEDLSDFTRQKTEKHLSGVDLNEIARAANDMVAPMLKKSTNHFTMKLQNNLPTLKGNSQQLEQVVINLLINACQSLQDKSQKMEISTSYDANNHHVVLKVADEGYGITEIDLSRIFDPFFTTRRDSGGTGLGLSISRSIIEKHGGEIKFDSKPGKGTTVTVKLPSEK